MITEKGPIGDLRETAIAGAITVRSYPFQDERGRFARLFDGKILAPISQGRPIVQVNQSMTRNVGAVRGLHFQRAPHLECKWVRCVKGRVFDVAVDLRRGSPTFLQHAAVELSAAEANMFFIPEGCAHGFQVLEPESELIYLHSAPYAPDAEGGLRWDDPVIAIHWPLPALDISTRDLSHPLISNDFEGIEV